MFIARGGLAFLRSVRSEMSVASRGQADIPLLTERFNFQARGYKHSVPTARVLQLS